MKVILWSKFKETTRREDETSDRLKQTTVLRLTPCGREAKLQLYPRAASSAKSVSSQFLKADYPNKRMNLIKQIKMSNNYSFIFLTRLLLLLWLRSFCATTILNLRITSRLELRKKKNKKRTVVTRCKMCLLKMITEKNKNPQTLPKTDWKTRTLD